MQFKIAVFIASLTFEINPIFSSFIAPIAIDTDSVGITSNILTFLGVQLGRSAVMTVGFVPTSEDAGQGSDAMLQRVASTKITYDSAVQLIENLFSRSLKSLI